MSIHSTGKYGNLYFIGTVHSSTTPDQIIKEIEEAPLKPSTICVEAPEGLKPDSVSEHKAVIDYKSDFGNASIDEIDMQRGDYVPDREDFDVKNLDEFDDPKTRDEIRQGYDEAINPQASEHVKERDQMMALELQEYLGTSQRVVVIVGGMHVEGIINSLTTLKKKYQSI